jgi:hypothetical protein
LLTKPVVTAVIIGAKRLEQLQDKLAAVDLKLTEEEIEQLDGVSTLPSEYPDWIVSFQKRQPLGTGCSYIGPSAIDFNIQQPTATYDAHHRRLTALKARSERASSK